MYKFIGRTSWREGYISLPFSMLERVKKNEVKILRPLWFYHAEQKGLTVEDLLKYFTDEAVMKFQHDEFISIIGW